ncbi:SDR family oxidoreductase [Subtercola lobariae]|uniref:3-oxoacyl-ACP reductase n=1 Tax=Subtercola lobariae TaxID=1588641 RepID=A0A917B1J0_9MICO|nr:SDR family NAD(P)-dependent oxidoreductase [Subtercola lobariae]GGF14827.1 3-oxoacyl-ACP reductase [Subtercola lobariae]
MTETREATTGRYVGRTVLITGAAQGLGLAMAERFAFEGASLAIGDLSEDAITDAARHIHESYGVDVTATRMDVTDSTHVTDWVAASRDRHGTIDVLINNAGIIRDNRIENISDEDWAAVVDVSLTGAFLCSRAVFPHMRNQRYGRIISFSSMSWRGNFGQVNYVAAKAGVVGLTRGLALEGARYGITANAIAPGLISTPMLESMNAEARTLLVGKVPMKRAGDPSNIAEGAAFLASEAASYITGVVLDIDGGISIGSSLR